MSDIKRAMNGDKQAFINIIEEHKGQAPDIDIQVQRGIGQHVLRSLDQLQQRLLENQPQRHQHGAHCAAENQRGMHGGFHIGVQLCPEVARHHHRAADIAAKGKGDKDQRDLIAVANGSQGVFADKLARHQAIGNVVKLLKNDAAKQRQAEGPQHLFGLSYG